MAFSAASSVQNFRVRTPDSIPVEESYPCFGPRTLATKETIIN